MNVVDPANYSETLALGDSKIGDILIESGRLSKDNAARVLRLQKAHGERFGDAASLFP